MPEQSRSRAGFAAVAHCVSKTYGVGAGRVDALCGVSLRLEPGEFVALTGPSGCGKSTLLHLLAGLDTPTGGTVLVNNTDIGRLDEDDRTAFRGRNIGVVFQAFNLLDFLSAEENVSLPLALAGVPHGKAAHRAREALDRVGLRDRAGARPAELSGGQQQRVAVARAIVADPPLILADEPTGNLDTETGRRVFDLFRDLARTGNRSVLLVTHDPTLAARADRIVQVRDGRVLLAAA